MEDERKIIPTLKDLLSRRGLKVFNTSSRNALFIPEHEYIEEFYKLMSHYAFRLFIRDVLKQETTFKREDVTRYATREVTEKYLNFLVKTGLVKKVSGGYRKARSDISSFGDTLEWYVAELLQRDYAMECLWGVSFKGTASGGDYDVLARLDSGIMYVEVKSSPPRQIYDRDINAFLRRVQELCPEFAVFFVDTHLRMKDKIVVLFTDALRQSGRTQQPERLKDEIFIVRPIIYITNSKPSISGNLQFIISHYYRRQCID